MAHRSSSSPMRFSFAPLESGGGGPARSFHRMDDRLASRRRDPRSIPRVSVSRPPTTRPATSPATLRRIVVGALVWLLLGCSGLMWVIAFTTDIDSLVLALAVWVLAFVGPSLCATSLAYRLDGDEAGSPSADPESV